MTKRQEMATLKEIGRVYHDPPERVTAYNRRKWILLMIAWFEIFIAISLSMLHAVPDMVCLVIAVVGGCAVGIAVWFTAAARQIPLLVRYTTLREEDIRKRLEELKDA
jgi:hypothetical protein